MSASQDSLVSSMAAHSSPLGFTPAARKASSGTRRSVFPIPSRPRASASRRAGSTVRTSTLPPRRAAAMAAAAAAVVVLPTPPGPQATMISFEASRPSSEAARAVDLRGAALAPSGAELFAERRRPGGWCAARAGG